MKTFSVEPIGVIRSEIKNIEDAPLFYTEGAPSRRRHHCPHLAPSRSQGSAKSPPQRGRISSAYRSIFDSITRSSEPCGASPREGLGNRSKSSAYCCISRARRLRQLEFPCIVVAPSMTPKRAGDRIKTDRRDAVKLARLLRAGELKAIYIPEPTDEAIRDLCRARTDAGDHLRRSRYRLKALLLRHGYRYHGKSAWSQAHMRYLRELVLPDPAMKVILEDYLMAISAAQERIQRCERAMIDRLPSWRLKAAVDTLMAFKGFQLLAAMITVSELGALQRFDHPRQVMAYLGLVPSESTSSEKRRQGGITKSGSSHARWILIECAQHYAAPPKVSKELSHRQSGQPPEVIARAGRHKTGSTPASCVWPQGALRATRSSSRSPANSAPSSGRFCATRAVICKSMNIVSKRPKGRIGRSREPRFPATTPLRGTTTTLAYHTKIILSTTSREQT